MLPLKPLYIATAVALVLLLTLLERAYVGRSQATSDIPAEDQDISLKLNHSGIRDIPPDTSILYAKVELDVSFKSSFKPPALQELAIPFPQLKPIQYANQTNGAAGEHGRIKVQAAKAPPLPDMSNFVFGVATLLDRLRESLDAFVHWASGNGARIIAVIPEGSLAEEISSVIEKAMSLKIDLSIIQSSLEFEDRYFTLIKVLHEHRGTAQWAAYIDDDTFFPNIYQLKHALAKYDPTLPWYVGGLSEDLSWVMAWNIIAIGGAGIFVSTPLLTQLLPHYDTCMAVPGGVGGDRRIAYCIFTHTTTRLTVEPLLHQVDLMGDVTGFYEALRPQALSVHHWKSWHWHNMTAAALVSKVCGDDCIFQHYHFSDDWHLTNGFSLVWYTHDRGPGDTRMEKTWADSAKEDQEEAFLYSLAPLRPKDEGKIQYLMEAAVYDEKKEEVRQFYVRRLPDDLRTEIVEVVWRKERRYWIG